MEDALAKIRPHTSSSLPHQKAPATLLLAIESTLKEQKADLSPTAYFAALLTVLEGSLQRKDTSLDDGAVLPAELYLLALFAPFVSKAVIRAHLGTLLNLTAPLFPLLTPHAPPLRSQLSLYHTLFQSIDRSQIDTLSIRQTFSSILNLCLDPRPKVRKKAADAIKDALRNPPSPFVRHPYAEKAADWVKSALTESSSVPFTKGKTKSSGSPENAIHILAFLRPVLPHLPPSSFPEITKLLLNLPRLGNPYLSQSSYSILSDLFVLPDENDESKLGDQLSEVLHTVLSSPPTKTDVTVSPAWVQLLGDAMQAYKSVDADACGKELNRAWKAIWSFLDSNDATTRKAAAQSLSSLVYCIPPSLVVIAVSDPQGSSILSKIISQCTKALDNISYAGSMPELLALISSLVSGLRDRRSRQSPSAAEALLLPLIVQVGELRTRKAFEYKEAADGVLSTAMQALGPEVLFRVLPLNLEPEQRQAGKEPRAYLLPLLVHPHPSPLSHFVSYFVPLSEKMFDLQQTAELEGRHSEAKVWSVLIGQVWTGLAGYCYAPVDLNEAFSPAFAQLLSQLLYSQTELRPAILKTLKVLVDSNQTPTDESQRLPIENLTPEEISSNVTFLKTQAESWLAVLFNVFGSVSRHSKGMVGDVISAWASIAEEPVINGAYQKVIDLFKSNLVNAQNAPATPNATSEAGSATATTQDILLLLIPYLSNDDAKALFDFCLCPQVLSGKDNGVQKRGYKILANLIQNEKVEIDAPAVLNKLDEQLEGLTPAAKKDRFNLISAIVPHLPPSALHVIPSLIPEVVLGTKEPSEKARGAAFEAILVMGRKMSAGGVVKRNLMDDMEQDDNAEAVANLEEFMTMMAGGLAGASAHMISATVTAISRLVFEFKDAISAKMHNEIIQTLLVFLTSANREIVKSVLGFIKLAVHILPTELLRSHLSELVPALLKWSHDHNNHFKVKVRYIFERMLRRFVWEDVYAWAGTEEAGKVLLNIKKRKDRAKRKKAAREVAEDSDNNELPARKPTIGDAFEDVLYGNESELEDSDDDDDLPVTNKPGKKKRTEQGARLKLDDDEPMDLLRGAAGHITNAKSNHRRKPGQEATHFRTDENTGKMVIDDDSDGNVSDAVEDGSGENISGNAYKESLTSVDGFSRGPGGRIKFNKDTKKRRRQDNNIDEDVEMADGEPSDTTGKKGKKQAKTEPRLGHEFKAKRAGGDVKKHGLDPYAYLSLSEAAKRGKGNKRIGIASRR